MACADAGEGSAGFRQEHGLREGSLRGAAREDDPLRAGYPQREDRLQDPRGASGGSCAVHADHRREGSGDEHRLRPRPRHRRDRDHDARRVPRQALQGNRKSGLSQSYLISEPFSFGKTVRLFCVAFIVVLLL